MQNDPHKTMRPEETTAPVVAPEAVMKPADDNTDQKTDRAMQVNNAPQAMDITLRPAGGQMHHGSDKV
jgi:hypothetical protein